MGFIFYFAPAGWILQSNLSAGKLAPDPSGATATGHLPRTITGGRQEELEGYALHSASGFSFGRLVFRACSGGIGHIGAVYHPALLVSLILMATQILTLKVKQETTFIMLRLEITGMTVKPIITSIHRKVNGLLSGLVLPNSKMDY